MSRNDGTTDGALACKHGCGRSFGNAGAKARHEQACEPSGEPDSAALRADDVEIREIASMLPNLRERDLRATCEAHDHTPADSDTPAEAAAKALIRAKSGGKEAYVAVFGTCDEDGCEYGRNGFATRKCKRHEGEREAEPETPDSGDSEPDTADEPSGDASEDARAQYVAALIREGVAAEDAETAANVRFDG